MHKIVMDNKKEIKKISGDLNPLRNISFLILDYSLIILSVSISVMYESTYLYVLSIIIIGSRMRALVNLLHEASHNFLNTIYGELFCALPLFTSFNAYRKAHMRHHLHFGEFQDPDLERYVEAFGHGVAINGANSKYMYLKEIFNLRSFFIYSYIYPLKKMLNMPGLFDYKFMILFWMMVCSIFYKYDFLMYILMYWLIPYLTTFKVISYIAELFEHFGLYSKYNDQLRSTRNIYMNKFLLFLIWPHGDNYHLIHHLFAFVPGYNLKKIDKYLCDTCDEYKHHRSFYSLGV